MGSQMDVADACKGESSSAEVLHCGRCSHRSECVDNHHSSCRVDLKLTAEM